MSASASVYDICTRNSAPTRSTNTNVTAQRPRWLPSRITSVHRRAVDPRSPWDDADRENGSAARAKPVFPRRIG